MVRESQIWKEFDVLIGCDEAGRGPLAGPVVAASFIVFTKKISFSAFSKWCHSKGIKDSKKTTAIKRQKIRQEVFPWSLEGHLQGPIEDWGWASVQEVSAQDIDRINILQASLLAMKNSAKDLIFQHCREKKEKIAVLIDGPFSFPWDENEGEGHALALNPVISGDQSCFSIGLASLVAKTWRDQRMENYHEQWPHYGFKQHAGYPTQAHREALKKWGPCPIHRLSFKGVEQYAKGFAVGERPL